MESLDCRRYVTRESRFASFSPHQQPSKSENRQNLRDIAEFHPAHQDAMDQNPHKRRCLSAPTTEIRAEPVEPAQYAPLPYKIYLSIVDACIAIAEEKASYAPALWDITMSPDAAGEMVMGPTHLRLARLRFDHIRSVSQVDQRSRRAVHRAFPALPFHESWLDDKLQWNATHPLFVPFACPKADGFQFSGGLGPEPGCKNRVGKPWPHPPGALRNGPEGPAVFAHIETCFMPVWDWYSHVSNQPLHYRFLSQMPNLKTATVVDRFTVVTADEAPRPKAAVPHAHELAVVAASAKLDEGCEWMRRMDWQPLLLMRGVRLMCMRPMMTSRRVIVPSQRFEVLLGDGGGVLLREIDLLCTRCPRVFRSPILRS